MKKSFLFFLLIALSHSAYAQKTLQTNNQWLQNSYPFAVGTVSLQTEVDLVIATLLEDMSPTNDVLTQAQYVPFILESGLYSGFGTAWYRNNSASFESISEVDSFEWHCDLLSSSLISKENLVLPLFEPDLQVSLGYYNSF